jgi:hypothetical protein
LIPLIANEPDQKRYGAHCQQDPRHDGDTARRNPIQMVILVPAQLIFAQAQKGMVVSDRAQIDTANLNMPIATSWHRPAGASACARSIRATTREQMLSGLPPMADL